MMTNTTHHRFRELSQQNRVPVIVNCVSVIVPKTEKPNDFKGRS